MTHICVGDLTIIGLDNGLSPGRHQAIIWTNDGIFLIEAIWKNFNEILVEIHSRKCIWKCHMENGGLFVSASRIFKRPRGQRVEVGTLQEHYSYVIMSAMASQITGVSIVYWNVCKDQWKYQNSAPLAHSAPTGARNSSLGHPNMAEASLGKNFPKVIPSLLHVFNGWYLPSLVIWRVSLSRPQIFWGKRRHLARRGDISSRDARISTRGCPKLQRLD